MTHFFVLVNAPDAPSHLLAIYPDSHTVENIRAEWDRLRGGYYEIRKGSWDGFGKLPEYQELTRC